MERQTEEIWTKKREKEREREREREKKRGK